jgi:uncharacterized protein with HEPN domain
MALLLIGEAASKLSEGFTQAHPEVEWRKVIAFRNFLVHEYHRVDVARVYEIATVDAPTLAAWLATVMPRRP